MMLRKLFSPRPILLGLYGWMLVSATGVLADCSADGGHACSLDTPDHLGIPQVSVASAATDIIGILSFIAGVLSAIFIIVAGIRYIISSGNSQRTEAAKQTLTYAVIGLIISVLALSIVGFITAKAP